MNAAFLLVTTAWLAGDTPKDANVAAANCCPTTCCEPCGHRHHCHLLDKLRRCFHRDCCDNHCPPQCPPACPPPKCCETKCCPTDCCGHRHRFSLFNCFKHNCCDNNCQPQCQPVCCKPVCCKPVCCQSSCQPVCCDDACGHSRHHCGLLSKLKGLFHRCNDCCNDCNGGACAGGTAPKSGETIQTQPKKMPGGKEVHFDSNPPALAPVAPAIQTAPTVTPANEGIINRNPF